MLLEDGTGEERKKSEMSLMCIVWDFVFSCQRIFISITSYSRRERRAEECLLGLFCQRLPKIHK